MIKKKTTPIFDTVHVQTEMMTIDLVMDKRSVVHKTMYVTNETAAMTMTWRRYGATNDR